MLKLFLREDPPTLIIMFDIRTLLLCFCLFLCFGITPGIVQGVFLFLFRDHHNILQGKCSTCVLLFWLQIMPFLFEVPEI